jgi:hypothetical protein
MHGPFCLDLTTFASTSLVFFFTSPLQAKPFIAREAGRPLGKICALYGSKKSIDLRKGKRQFAAQLLGLPFYTTKDAALRFLAGLGDGFVFQILKI